MKGKQWPADDEKQLRDWVKSGISLEVIVFSFDGKYSKDGVLQKAYSLGLKVEEEELNFASSSSSNLILPPQLPSVEDALKKLTAAIAELEKPGISRAEILRLRSIIFSVKIYQPLFAEYVNYRGLEEQVVKMRQRLADYRAKNLTQ